MSSTVTEIHVFDQVNDVNRTNNKFTMIIILSLFRTKMLRICTCAMNTNVRVVLLQQQDSLHSMHILLTWHDIIQKGKC